MKFSKMENKILVYTILTFFSCILVAGNNLVYEYGKDPGFRSFTDRITGEIGSNEQHKKIFLNLPSCSIVQYVRVEVQNEYSVPRVAYDRATRRVIVAYSPLQQSASTYTIQVKSTRAYSCSDKYSDQYIDDATSRIAMDYYGY